MKIKSPTLASARLEADRRGSTGTALSIAARSGRQTVAGCLLQARQDVHAA